LRRARAAGLDREDVVALVETTLRATFQQQQAPDAARGEIA
jgi:GntR family transcriptional regulator